MAEKQRGTKEPLDKGERGEWKSWLEAQHEKHKDHDIRSHHFMANRRGKVKAVIDFLLGRGLQNHCRWWLQPWNEKSLGPWKESYDKPRQCIKKQRQHFADKLQYSQSYGFSNSHVQMWEFDHKEGWVPKNWCFWVTVSEKTLESPWTARRSN